MSVRVRRIRRDEPEALRDVRLRALADSPSAFGSTLAREEAYGDDLWEERARACAAGDGAATFLAVDGDQRVGMVTALATGGGLVELVGMWTAPEVRGRGVGARLVEAVIGWAGEVGAERVELWVTRGNEPAERLYRRLGFEPTGDHQPLPSDPCKDELRMARHLRR